MLKLDYSTNSGSIWLTDLYTIRKIIGFLGMALPPKLYLTLWLASGHWQPLPSISHYYFTRVSGVFIIAICLIATFLILYKGKEPVDFIVSTISGTFALLMLLFPTGNLSPVCCNPEMAWAVTQLSDCAGRFYFHYACAAIFLTGLAGMSLFLFTKTNQPQPGTRKKLRNAIYIACGIVMLLCMLAILAGTMGIIPKDFYLAKHLTFWFETIAIEAFSFSWMVKGGVIFKD